MMKRALNDAAARCLEKKQQKMRFCDVGAAGNVVDHRISRKFLAAAAPTGKRYRRRGGWRETADGREAVRLAEPMARRFSSLLG